MNQASMQVMIQASWQDIKPANTQEPSVLIHELYTRLKGIQEPTEVYETLKKLFARQSQCMPEIEAQYATFAQTQSAKATMTAQLILPQLPSMEDVLPANMKRKIAAINHTMDKMKGALAATELKIIETEKTHLAINEREEGQLDAGSAEMNAREQQQKAQIKPLEEEMGRLATLINEQQEQIEILTNIVSVGGYSEQDYKEATQKIIQISMANEAAQALAQEAIQKTARENNSGMSQTGKELQAMRALTGRSVLKACENKSVEEFMAILEGHLRDLVKKENEAEETYAKRLEETVKENLWMAQNLGQEMNFQTIKLVVKQALTKITNPNLLISIGRGPSK